MTRAAILLALVLRVGAQDVVTLPGGPPRPGASDWTLANAADSDLHANVRKLMELSGSRERLQLALPRALSDAKAKMLQRYPGVSPAFASEWEKRMAARITVDDFLEAAARIYEKHFTAEEIGQLIAALNAKKAGKVLPAPAQLQQKVAAEMPALLGEIAGATTELTVRIGSEVGGQIGKEHPEYLRLSPGGIRR
jgi:hypothetical protein